MSKKYDLVVIGAGPGGYVAAIRASQLGMKVACIDKRKNLGGTCLNIGCIPSKALLHSSKLYSKISKESKECGIEVGDITLNFERMMSRKEGIVKGFEQGIEGIFKKNRIKTFCGEAHLVSPNTVRVKDDSDKKIDITAKYIVLATGSESVPLPFLEFDGKRILSSTEVLSLPNVPKTMIVVGAGAIGLELGSVYSRLGTEVIFVEFCDCICPLIDTTVSKAMERFLVKQGMIFHLGHAVTKGKVSDESVSLIIAEQKHKQTSLITAEVALIAIGRKPFTKNLELERVGVKTDDNGFVQIDSSFRTAIPNIYAIGDIVDGPMLAHKASEEGIAVAEIIAGHQPHINYMAIPWIIYTSPEVACVGMSENEAKKSGLSIKIGKFPFKVNSRARCTNEIDGFVKVVAEEKTGRLLGMHIFGENASEMICSAVIAIEKRATVQEMASYTYSHPTLSEAIKEACLSITKSAIHM